MNALKKFIIKNSSGKKVLWLFIITNVVLLLMMTVTIPTVMNFSKGLKLFDLMPMGYDFEYANNLLTTLGAEGRIMYLTYQIPIDMIYPFLFGVSYCLMIAYLLKKVNKLESVFYITCLIPFIAAIADYIENFGVTFILINFPDISEGLIEVISGFTVIKSSTTTLYFIVLIILIIGWALKSKDKRKIV